MVGTFVHNVCPFHVLMSYSLRAPISIVKYVKNDISFSQVPSALQVPHGDPKWQRFSSLFDFLHITFIPLRSDPWLLRYTGGIACNHLRHFLCSGDVSLKDFHLLNLMGKSRFCSSRHVHVIHHIGPVFPHSNLCRHAGGSQNVFGDPIPKIWIRNHNNHAGSSLSFVSLNRCFGPKKLINNNAG